MITVITSDGNDDDDDGDGLQNEILSMDIIISAIRMNECYHVRLLVTVSVQCTYLVVVVVNEYVQLKLMFTFSINKIENKCAYVEWSEYLQCKLNE